MSSSLFRKLLLDYFPTPRFLEMPAVGLDISDEMIRFAELKRVHDHFELEAFGQQAIDPDIIEEGYIKNKNELIKVLISFRRKYGLHFIKALFPEEKAYLFKTQIPIMPESEIRGAIQFKIEENVPVPLTDAVFDYRIIKTPAQGEMHIDVGVTVVHAKVVESYLGVFRAAGLVPLEFRTEAQAITHAVIPRRDDDTYIIVAVRETKIVVAIVSHHVVHFTSTLPMGRDDVIASMNKTENVKESSNKIFLSLVSASDSIKEEIQKLFTYWEDRADAKGDNVKHIILLGSGALHGLNQYLSEVFSIPVHIANAWENTLSFNDTVPPITQEESLDYAPALGLALPYDL